MYAVVKTGGKQYKVSEGDVVRVEKLAGDPGEDIVIDKVLMVTGDDKPLFGRPFLENASVTATIVKQDRKRKILVFHKKRRKGYKKMNGHRQPFTELKITGINV